MLRVDGDGFAHQLAEPMAALIVSLAAAYDAIVAPATTSGKNIMPRVAALLDVMQVSDITKVIAPDTFERPIYAGNAHADREEPGRQEGDHRPRLGVQAGGDRRRGADRSGGGSGGGRAFLFRRRGIAKSARPELTAAKIVISGGRAFGSSENFRKYLEPIADKLGAAIGASRAAVDAGYAPNDFQVGQTGKVVAPDLYIACGISGAIQHLAGMKDAKVIVAINKDAGGADLPDRRLRPRRRSFPDPAGARKGAVNDGPARQAPLTRLAAMAD